MKTTFGQWRLKPNLSIRSPVRCPISIRLTVRFLALSSVSVFIWTEEEVIIDDLRRRSAAVFEDHLRLAGKHQFEEDIERNVSPDIIILERRGIFRGREGARQLARLLEQELPKAPYSYTNRLLEGRVAFL